MVSPVPFSVLVHAEDNCLVIALPVVLKEFSELAQVLIDFSIRGSLGRGRAAGGTFGHARVAGPKQRAVSEPIGVGLPRSLFQSLRLVGPKRRFPGKRDNQMFPTATCAELFPGCLV